MIADGYVFRFRSAEALRQAAATLRLALVAAGGIHGEARGRMDAAYATDPVLCAIAVDASTQVGQDVAGIFGALLGAVFGSAGFTVRPLGQEVQA